MANAKDPKFIEAICKKYRRTVVTFHKMSDGVKTDIDAKILTFFNDDQERLYSAVETLYNVSCFCERSRKYETFFLRYWERINPDNKSTEQLLDDAKELLNYFEEKLKPILHMSYNNAMLEELEAEKAMLGRYFNRMGLESGNNNKHYLFETIRKYRNSIHKNSSIEDPGSGQYLIPHNDDEDLENLIYLCSCGLLIIVDYYRDSIEKYLNEHEDKFAQQEQKQAEAEFNLDTFISEYVTYLSKHCKNTICDKLGKIGGISNDGSNLISLQLMKEMSYSEADFGDDQTDNEAESGMEGNDSGKECIPMESMARTQSHVNFILGKPGAGKTTVLLNLAAMHCEAFTNETDTRIPIFISLSKISNDGDNLSTIIVHTLRGFRVYDASDQTIFDHLEKKLKDGKVVFYIDGLNEISVSRPGAFMERLKEFISEYDACTYYLTGRKYEFAEYRSIFSNLDNHEIYEILEIKREQILKFMRSLGVKPGIMAEFEKKIEDTGISKLLGTPHNFHMIAEVLLKSGTSALHIRNRGELLKEFIGKKLRDNSESPDSNLFYNMASQLLQKIAREIFLQGQQSISMTDLIHIGKALEITPEKAHTTITRLESLNIVRQEHILSQTYVCFFVDTYQEYFLALDLVEDFIKGVLNIDVSNQKHQETLKLMVEIINVDTSGKSIRLGRDLINVIARQGETNDPAILNRNLELMALIVSGMDSKKMKEMYPDARLTVENIIRNYLVHYRCTHPCPNLCKDFPHLSLLLKCAAILSSQHILEEMLSLYWMDIIGVMNQTETGPKSKGSAHIRYRLRNIIIKECGNITELYDEMQALYMDLIWPYRKSATNMLKFIHELLGNISIEDQKILYRHINSRIERNENEANSNAIVHLKNDENYLLLCIEDIDFLAKYDIDRDNSKIAWMPIHSLMRLYSSDRISEIVFSDKFINKLYKRREQLLYMIRFHLFRNRIPGPLHDLLFGNGSKILEYLKDDNDPDGTISFRELLDILPISDIPEHIARKYYHENTYRFILNRIESDYDESFEALNYRRDSSSKNLRIIIKNVRTSFKEKYALFSINGERHAFRILADGCENIMTEEAICIRERVLTLERPPRGIIPGDKGEVQFAEFKDNRFIPVQVDKRKMEDEEFFDRKLYQTISTGPLQNRICQYNMIGQNGDNIWITCEPIINKNDLLNGIIVLKSADKDIEIAGTIKTAGRLEQDITILTLRSASIPKIDRYGTLTVIQEDGRKDDIEYIYAYVQHRVVTIRLFNSPYIDSLVRRKGARFRITTFDMMFESIDTIRTRDTFCIEASLGTGQLIDVPKTGNMAVRTADKMIQLIFDNSYHIKDNPSIKKGKISYAYINPEENRAEFFIDDNRINPYSGRYLSIAGSSLHIMIQTNPIRPEWIAQIRLVLETGYPVSGHLSLSDPECGRFRYTTVSEEDRTIRIWPEDGYKGRLEDFMALLKKEDQMVTIEGHGMRLVSSVQDCETKKKENHTGILITDFRSSNKKDVSAWKNVHGATVSIMCMNHFRNLKKNETGPEAVRLNIVAYTGISRGVIRIKVPQTSLEGLLLKLDGGLMCTANVISSKEEYADIRLRTLNGLTPKVRDEGSVKFYRKTDNGYTEEYVGYNTVYEIIEIEKPEKYHADICNIIEEELIEKMPGEMNHRIIDFFKEKSRAFMLISNPLLFERIRTLLDEENDQGMYFDVCKIHSADNDVQLRAISGLGKCSVNSSDTSSLLSNHRYTKGDYILYEKNHKVHYIEDPQKHSCMGFHMGTVIKLLEDRDGQIRSFIKVHGLGDEYYCPEKHELGTIVSFFYSINLNESDEQKQALALDTKATGMSDTKNGTILSIRKDESDGYDRHFITIAAEDSETDIGTVEIYERSREWETVSQWKAGDKCRYFMCCNEMYLKF